MYEIKLKKELTDRDFIVIWLNDESATVEFDKWNRCPKSIFEEYKSNKDFEVRELDNITKEEIEFSMPQNRLVRDNVAMAINKRKFNKGE
jgi:hypothetical protein